MLNKPSTGVVTMNYATANGTALAGSDYSATSGVLSFAPGEMSKTVKVALLNDAVIETSETFSLNLSGAAGATLADATGVATIHANDGVAAATVSASVSSVQVSEAADWAEFRITLNQPCTSAVGLTYGTFNGTALAGSDYVGQSGVVTFAPGEMVKTVRVSLINDTAVESTESFGLEIYWPTAGLLLGQNKGTATITNDDAAPVVAAAAAADTFVFASSAAPAEIGPQLWMLEAGSVTAQQAPAAASLAWWSGHDDLGAMLAGYDPQTGALLDGSHDHPTVHPAVLTDIWAAA